MIGKIVAEYPRHRQGATTPFVVTHDPSVHQPWGLHRSWLNGREIGRQLSLPSVDDCFRMLNPEPERPIPPLPGYTASTKARQKALQPCRRAEILADDHYGRLLVGEGLLP